MVDYINTFGTTNPSVKILKGVFGLKSSMYCGSSHITTLFLENYHMNYEKIYNQIINKAQTENRQKGKGIYFEQHHIKPKCMGGDNTKENLVLLTGREHYICHKLLWKMYPDNNKLLFAYNMMAYVKRDYQKRDFMISSKEYDILKINYSKCVSIIHKGKVLSLCTKEKMSKSKTGENNPFYGENHTEETKRIIGSKSKGRNVGAKRSNETKKKMSDSMKGENNHFYNKKHTEETKMKISESSKGRTHSDETKKILSEKRKEYWRNRRNGK